MRFLTLQVNCLHDLPCFNCLFATRLHTMELDIKAASKAFHVSRPTIYKRINSGELSRLANGRIDMAEMLRVFGEPSSRKPVNVNSLSKEPVKAYSVNDTLHKEKEAFLQDKIRFLEDNLREARNREEWLKEQVKNLSDTVKLLQAPTVHKEETTKKKGFISRLFG